MAIMAGVVGVLVWVCYELSKEGQKEKVIQVPLKKEGDVWKAELPPGDEELLFALTLEEEEGL